MRFGFLYANTIILCLFLYATGVFASDSDATNRSIIVDPDDGTAADVITVDSVKRLAVDAQLSGIEASIDPRPGRFFAKFVENAGSKDLNVDGSVTPVIFLAVPDTGKKLFVHTISLVLEDASINFIKFGGIPALTNGVDIKLKEGGLAEVSVGNFKKNSDFYVFGNDIVLESASTDVLRVLAEIKTNSGTTFQLADANSEFFKIIVNDDLTSINRFNMLIRGFEVDE